MKRLALACACAATLLAPAGQVRAQFRPRDHPPPTVSRPGRPRQDEDRDRRFDPAFIPHPLTGPLPRFRPGSAEPRMPPAHPPFQVPLLPAFHPPAGVGAAAKAGPWTVRGIGAALAIAFGALCGSRRKKDGNG